MSKSLVLLVAAAACLAACPAGVFAQDGAAPAKPSAFERLATFGQADLSLPASPAFAVLGLSPDKVERPTSLRTLGATVLRSLGEDGKPVNGVAIDATPVLLFAPRLITAGTGYAGSEAGNDLSFRNYGTRLLTRTTVSLATTSADPDGASRLAWGIRVGLVDQADPGLFYQATVDCLRKNAPGAIPSGRATGSAPASDAMESCLSTALTDSAGNSRPLWARFSLYAGYGQSWYSKSGALTDRAPATRTFWLTSSYGLAGDAKDSGGMRTLIQGYLERKLDARAADPGDAGALITENSTQAIVRLKTGTTSWHGFAEGGLSRVHLGNNTTERLRHLALGAEFNLGKAFAPGGSGMESWLQVASVRELGFSNGKDNTGVALSLKFGAPVLELPGVAASP